MNQGYPLLLDLEFLPQGKKIYFASDFHLGAPNEEKSREREIKLVRWLDQIKADAHSVFLVGDIFDFWFEYKRAIPKGFIRFQGKLAELADRGIPIYIFTGNHDMWLFDYFPKQIGAKIIRENVELKIGSKRFFVGHGDGLGPGDGFYKILKAIFANKVCQWLFERIHPNLGIYIAESWSRKSRIQSQKEDDYNEENERLIQFCKDLVKKDPFDFLVFGHRHLPLDVGVGPQSRYINLGEWVNYSPYAEFDGESLILKEFK